MSRYTPYPGCHTAKVKSHRMVTVANSPPFVIRHTMLPHAKALDVEFLRVLMSYLKFKEKIDLFVTLRPLVIACCEIA